MAEPPSLPQVVRFGVFELDLRSGQLKKRGMKIRLPDQPFRVLVLLLEHPGEVITREQLCAALWPQETFVEFEHSLNAAVAKLRQALSDSADNPRFVETIARRGYRWISSTETAAPASAEPVAVAGSLRKTLESDPVQKPRASLGGYRRSFSLVAAGAVLKGLGEAMANKLGTPTQNEGRPTESPLLVPTALVLPRKNRIRLFLAASLFAAGLSAFWLSGKFRQWPLFYRPPSSLAVLPFTDLSPNKDQEYFSDGLTEELINSLSKLEGLRVVSRTSSFHFKGRTDDVRRIGMQLNVNTILDGAVRKSGDRFRITIELVDVANGYQLWSETYDRQVADVFDIQEAIARGVVEALRVNRSVGLTTPLVKRTTENAEAYNSYLKGRYFWNRRTEEDLEKAIQYFREAAVKDSRYAPAYAGLADAYGVLQNWGERPASEVWPLARAAARKAIEIDDTLAEAHLSLAHVKAFSDHDWAGAEKELRRALDLNPRSAAAHHWYAAVYLRPLGRLDDALAELRRAVELDPLAPVILAQMGQVLRWKGRDSEAIERLRKAIELEPNFVYAYEELAMAHLAGSKSEAALRDLERAQAVAPRRSLVTARLAYCYAVAGRSEEAIGILRELQVLAKRRYVSPYSFVVVYLGLGQKDAALEWLSTAVEQGDIHTVSIGVDPIFQPLYDDARFNALLKRMGLPLRSAKESQSSLGLVRDSSGLAVVPDRVATRH